MPHPRHQRRAAVDGDLPRRCARRAAAYLTTPSTTRSTSTAPAPSTSKPSFVAKDTARCTHGPPHLLAAGRRDQIRSAAKATPTRRAEAPTLHFGSASGVRGLCGWDAIGLRSPTGDRGGRPSLIPHGGARRVGTRVDGAGPGGRRGGPHPLLGNAPINTVTGEAPRTRRPRWRVPPASREPPRRLRRRDVWPAQS
jgi:hypothetical protein